MEPAYESLYLPSNEYQVLDDWKNNLGSTYYEPLLLLDHLKYYKQVYPFAPLWMDRRDWTLYPEMRNVTITHVRKIG